MWKPSNHSSSCALTAFHVFDTIFSFCKPSGTSIISLTQRLEAHFTMRMLTISYILTDGGVLLSNLPFPTGSLCEGSSVPSRVMSFPPHQGALSRCSWVFSPRSGDPCSFHMQMFHRCVPSVPGLVKFLNSVLQLGIRICISHIYRIYMHMYTI